MCWRRWTPLIGLVLLAGLLAGPGPAPRAAAAGFPDPNPDRQIDFARALAGVAVAPSGRLYVSSWRESKIYSWPSAAAAANLSSSADLIFGTAMDPENPPEGAGCGAVTSASFCGPEGIAVDTAGNLYVAATYQNRVQIFLNPETDASPTTADRTVGGLSGPRGLALDSAGRLYVADEFNYRVAVYNTPLAGAAAPDLVIGGTQGGATNQFNLPLAVALDGAGNLYVTDIFNSRVMRFDAPLQAGMSATQVYSGFSQPHDLAFDQGGNLFVSDVNGGNTSASRIAVIASPLTSSAVSYSIPNLNFPLGMDFDSAGNLYVGLCQGAYPCDGAGKLLVFNAPAAATPTPTPTLPPGALELSVDVAAGQHPISPLIYGVHGDGLDGTRSPALARELRLPLQRWGGNVTTRYNWQNDLSNHGSDFYFENIPKNNPNPQQGNAVDYFISQGRPNGTESIVTIPIIGWLAKDRADGQAGYDCGFDTRKYGAQQSTDPDNPDSSTCGNGVRPDGTTPVTGNDPLDTSVAAGPDDLRGWVQHLVDRYGAAGDGGVRFYGLDNEPGIWAETHRDVFPGYLSYDSLRDRAYQYGAMIKSVDPDAQVLGPVQDGWARYMYSAYLDQFAAQAQSDRDAHGQPFVPWYLDQMRLYEQQSGTRILDYLDLHYYPQADGVSLEPAGDAANRALRLRSTRALWDPTYVDESWIKDTEDGNVAVQLIPRMREWVQQHYPGTKLAISEYNWGALDDLNGALAQADVLGIFGREGLDLAVLFEPPQPDQPGAFAFRMYRDYDGEGSMFGDTGVLASSSDQAKLAIYAARRSADGALTLLVLNKTASVQAARLTLSNAAPGAAAQVYRYSAADLSRIVRQPDLGGLDSPLSTSFPAESITLIVVPGAAGPGLTPQAYLPLVRR
jgi:sugar lactone lactonase YvrE